METRSPGGKHRTRILVTGASGLLGINLALEASQEHSVYGLANSHPLHFSDPLHFSGALKPPPAALQPPFQVVEGDLLVPGTAERLLDEIQPDWVIHCAALANLDACEADPARAQQINTEVPRQLARLVARGGARLVHISTDAVFDGRRGQYSEDDRPNPIGVYSRTKYLAELAVLDENPQAMVARVNLYGYSISGRRSLGEFFLYNLLAGKPVNGFTDVIFCPLLVNDLARLLLKALEKDLTGIYHVVSSECISKYEFGMRVAQQFGLDGDLIQPISVKDSGLTAVRSPNLSLLTSKLAASLGQPPPDIGSGLAKFHRLYQQGYPQKILEMAKD